MTRPHLRRRHLTRGRRPPICLTVFFSVLISSALRGQVDCDTNAFLSIGDASAAPGEIAIVELRGSSLCEVTGFGMAIGHDSTRVDFIAVSPGQFLEDYAGDDLFLASWGFDIEGFVTLFVSFDLSFPFTVPPTSIEDDTVLATFFYRVLPEAEPGEQVVLLNEDGAYGNPPIANIFTSDDIARGVRPILESGSITIVPGPPRFRRGDANADGNDNLTDGISIVMHLFAGGPEPPCMKASDANDDGTVNLTDAIHVLTSLFKGGPAPAAPFVACGPDPTEDELTCVAFDACQ